MNHITVARWFKQFQEGRILIENNVHTSHPSTALDNTLIVIMSTLLDADRWMMVWEMEGTSGTPKTTIYRILTEYLMKKKVVAQWCTIHAVSSTKTMLYETVLETFDSLWKGRNCVSATNNHYRWKLVGGAWLQIRIEILEWCLKGKKFTKAATIPTAGFKSETNDDNGLQLY